MSQLAQRKASAEKQIADDRREIEGIDKEIGMFHQKLKTVSEVRAGPVGALAVEARTVCSQHEVGLSACFAAPGWQEAGEGATGVRVRGELQGHHQHRCDAARHLLASPVSRPASVRYRRSPPLPTSVSPRAPLAVRDAEALFSKARMLNRRMARRAASDHLTTMRGFTTTETTREYISAAPKNIGRKGLHETTSKLKMEPPAPTPPPSGAPATGKVGIATASRERTLGTRLTQRGQRGPLSKIGIARLALLAGAASWAAAGCANQGMRRKSGLTAGRRSL